MAGEKYAERAVHSANDYLESNLDTYITAVETAQSLDAGTVPDIEAFVPADVPEDGRSPLVETFERDGETESQTNQLFVYDLVTMLSYSSDADTIAAQRTMRRYMTALIDCLLADPTLGGTVEDLVLGGMQFGESRGADSRTRHVIALEYSIRLHQP